MKDLPTHEMRRLRAVATGHRHLQRLIESRLHGTPLQYLEGTAPFGPLDLVVDHRVLVPRPETEQLWEAAVDAVSSPPAVIVDLCTGSGALGLALAKTFPDARVMATDVSQSALEVAAINRRRVGLEMELRWGDLFDALPDDVAGRVDLVVANPPYVSEGEWDDLPADVRNEPRGALVAGPLGTEVWDRIAAGVAAWMAPEGVLVGEIGETQGDHLITRLEAAVGPTRVEDDLAGRPRFVISRLSSCSRRPVP